MRVSRWMTGTGLGALCAAAALLAPALQARENGRILRPLVRPVVSVAEGVAAFTPAAADPKLAAMLARSGIAGNGFRFTPSQASQAISRDVSVAARGRVGAVPRLNANNEAVSMPSVGIAPIAYNLGVSVGWKKLAVTGDAARAELPVASGNRDRANLGVSYSPARVTARLQSVEDRPLANTPVLLGGDKPSYSIDVGGSYALTRNIDLTAGVRAKSDRERLVRMNEDRRDSQGVYVGTAFRF